MTRSVYVTTTIPYVNAPPHVGFALELVQADALARYHRLAGGAVRLQTGTDENAFSNVLSARARGVPVAALVEENAARFRALCHVLDLSDHLFLRTTAPEHHRAVAAFLARLRPDDVYRAPYRGLYCPRCEDFFLERDAPGRICPEHAAPLEAVHEENYFFRLGRYHEAVREVIAARRLRVVPAAREAEVLRFVERGLDDISISRDAARSGGWGIPFPGDPSQVVYVWIDALINYLSGLGFPDGASVRRFWSDGWTTHVVGKNVWKFHAVYWPALLLSAGLPLPDRILVHGFLTQNGRKISKSRGDAGDPGEYVARFGSDAVRYYLLRHVHPFEDADFSVARLEAAYTSHLANGLGNLVSRLTALAEAFAVPGPGGTAPPAPPGYHEAFADARFDRAIGVVWEIVTDLNRAIAEARPWEALRRRDQDAAREQVAGWLRRLSTVGAWLEPFLPRSSAAIRQVLVGPVVRRCGPLFPRLEVGGASTSGRGRAFAR